MIFLPFLSLKRISCRDYTRTLSVDVCQTFSHCKFIRSKNPSQTKRPNDIKLGHYLTAKLQRKFIAPTNPMPRRCQLREWRFPFRSTLTAE